MHACPFHPRSLFRPCAFVIAGMRDRSSDSVARIADFSIAGWNKRGVLMGLRSSHLDPQAADKDPVGLSASSKQRK